MGKGGGALLLLNSIGHRFHSQGAQSPVGAAPRAYWNRELVCRGHLTKPPGQELGMEWTFQPEEMVGVKAWKGDLGCAKNTRNWQ